MAYQPQWIDPQIQKAAQPHFLALSSLDLDHSPDQQRALAYVRNMGSQTLMAISHKNRLLSDTLLSMVSQNVLHGKISSNLQQISMLVSLLDPKNLSLKAPSLMDRLFNRKEKYVDSLAQNAKTLQDALNLMEKQMRLLRQDNLTLDLEYSQLYRLYQSIEPVRDVLLCLQDTFPAWIERHPSKEALAFVRGELMEAFEEQSALFSQMELVCLQGLAALDSMKKGNVRLLESMKKIESVTMGAFWVALALSHQQIIQTPSYAPLIELSHQLDEALLKKNDLSFLPEPSALDDENLSDLLRQAVSLLANSQDTIPAQSARKIEEYHENSKSL